MCAQLTIDRGRSRAPLCLEESATVSRVIFVMNCNACMAMESTYTKHTHTYTHTQKKKKKKAPVSIIIIVGSWRAHTKNVLVVIYYLIIIIIVSRGLF